MNLKKMAQFIAARRKKLGYTQERVGKEIGVSAKAVSKWERGLSFPDIALIDDLASVLKCSVYDLMNGGIPNNEVNKKSSFDKTEVSAKNSSVNLFKTIFLDTNQNRRFSDLLFGSNLEHTRNSVHFGLSAQMLRNRKFVGKPCENGCAYHWNAIGKSGFFGFGKAYTRHSDDYYMKRKMECNSQKITSFKDGEICGICQDGLCVDAENKYLFSIVVQTICDCELKITLTSQDGRTLCCEVMNFSKGHEYIEKEIVLSLCGSCDNATLSITFDNANTVYIGAVSLMPQDNFYGMRKDVIELMKEMGISILRWPGGNFAGEYNWKDGLLPSNMRAPFESYLQIETQPQTMGYDFHEISIDDFVMLCTEIGAEPYITINLTWNTPEMSAQWVEYCNGDENTEYGKIRISRGHKEPYNVKFWSLGNEFGYGHMEGANSPFEYSKVARRHAETMLKVSPDIHLCLSGPYPNSEWATCSANVLSDIAQYVSLHHYVDYPDFMSPDKYKDEYEKFIEKISVIKLLSEKIKSDLKDDKLRISFDEWNSWNAWYRPGSVSDGIFAATMLHAFINQAEELGIDIACHFGATNEGAIVVDKKTSMLTPMGEAFAVMKYHKSGKILFADDNAVITEHDGKIIATLINASYDESIEFGIPICYSNVNGTVYYSDGVLPHTKFLKENVNFMKKKGYYIVKMPPHSMALFIQEDLSC